MRADIAVTGPLATSDQSLLRAYFGDAATGISPRLLEPGQVEQLASNKFSALPFSIAVEGIDQDLDEGLTSRLRSQQEQHGRWTEMLETAISLLDRLDVSCVLMKELASPFARMSDIDFLVPIPADVATIARELEARGFALYRFRLLSHPLKVMAVPGAQPLGTPPGIDLYPDAMWIRRHVLDGIGVVRRRQPRLVRGVTVAAPCREDDVYLVATHAFARGDITLAELDHGARLLSLGNLDWERMIRTSFAFGCVDALYIYLRLLLEVSRAAGLPDLVPATVLDDIEESAPARGTRPWLDRTTAELRVPVRLPLWLGTVRAARYHLSAVRHRLGPRELLFDAATHGLAVGAHLLRRD
jgi:hypothetical protein